MLRIFIGYDPRQPISYSVLQFSILRRASVPVSITPLVIETLPMKRQGLTPFTFTRFLVPHLCGYAGRALFLDADMLCLGDMRDLFNNYSDAAVSVSKNEHRFEWASAMLFNCGHEDNKKLTPDLIERANGLHQIAWTDKIGDLPREWNHLVGYDAPRPDAKLVHFTQGLPIYPETQGSEYAQAWRDEHKAMNFAEPWAVLMGNSVHAAQTADGRLVAKLHRDAL
jgi:lipopolysaccharide biosynthesis glycosyltransferase